MNCPHKNNRNRNKSPNKNCHKLMKNPNYQIKHKNNSKKITWKKIKNNWRTWMSRCIRFIVVGKRENKGKTILHIGINWKGKIRKTVRKVSLVNLIKNNLSLRVMILLQIWIIRQKRMARNLIKSKLELSHQKRLQITSPILNKILRKSNWNRNKITF